MTNKSVNTKIFFPLRELRNYKRKFIFGPDTKIGENTINTLNCCFFTVSLHFVTSNQISTYRKLNMSLTSSIYLVSRNAKKLKQTKVIATRCFALKKEKVRKPLKVAIAKTLFSSVCVIGKT